MPMPSAWRAIVRGSTRSRAPPAGISRPIAPTGRRISPCSHFTPRWRVRAGRIGRCWPSAPSPLPRRGCYWGSLPHEETPARTPLWLVLLRMVLAALIILALAHPLLNPAASLTGKGPLVLVVDNGWSAARQWAGHRVALDRFIAEAPRVIRNVVLLPTAPLPG